ncbi:hypothetical protein J6590_094310 [Homalodisca vitripennis]|nr:hypothetical protein J6590_094310 [Homalodisca vitripennis]
MQPTHLTQQPHLQLASKDSSSQLNGTSKIREVYGEFTPNLARVRDRQARFARQTRKCMGPFRSVPDRSGSELVPQNSSSSRRSHVIQDGGGYVTGRPRLWDATKPAYLYYRRLLFCACAWNCNQIMEVVRGPLNVTEKSGHTFMSADSFHHQVSKQRRLEGKVYNFKDFHEAEQNSNSKKEYGRLEKNVDSGLLNDVLGYVEHNVPYGKRFVSLRVRQKISPLLKKQLVPVCGWFWPLSRGAPLPG